MTKRVESLRAPCLDASSTLATSTNTTKAALLPLFVFVEVGESRSACCASADLSALWYERRRIAAQL